MPDYTPRQIQIIEAAIDVIAADGIQKLTIKTLAKAIGVTEPALYRHFKNKHEILESVLQYFAWQSREQVLAILQSSKSAVEKIGAFLDYYIETFSGRPALAAVIFSEGIFQSDRHLADTVLGLMDQSQRMMLEVVSSNDPDNDIRTDIAPAQLVTIILGSLRFLVNKWHLGGQGFDLRHEGALMWESVRQLIVNQNPKKE